MPYADISIDMVRTDHPVVDSLMQRLMTEMEARYPETGYGMALKPEDFVPPRGAFLLARYDGKPAGFGGVRRVSATTAEIKRMYVEPWARGVGLSRRILAALETTARDLGYAFLWLETGSRQPEAIRLYESSGYTPIKPYGEFRDSPLSVCFEKRLVAAATSELEPC